ncbi:hypothetical protein QBE52_02975 [Clostridiaceae bacterium 35-E11]
MAQYLRNLKSAIAKLGKDQTIAGNQLVFKEREALIVTGISLGIPVMAIAITYILAR